MEDHTRFLFTKKWFQSQRGQGKQTTNNKKQKTKIFNSGENVRFNQKN